MTSLRQLSRDMPTNGAMSRHLKRPITGRIGAAGCFGVVLAGALLTSLTVAVVGERILGSTANYA